MPWYYIPFSDTYVRAKDIIKAKEGYRLYAGLRRRAFISIKEAELSREQEETLAKRVTDLFAKKRFLWQ